MTEVTETKLPGVGVRYDFMTAGGVRLGVLVHESGRRDLLVDASARSSSGDVSVELDSDDSGTLAELLGASRVADHLMSLPHEVEGLAIDWIRVEPGSELSGQSLSEAAVHTTLGVSIVAILGLEGSAIAAPGADDVLVPGTRVVAVGRSGALERLAAKLCRT